MFRKIITTAFLVFAYITCNAQSSDGTMLLDDATSQTRVVTNAFLNASNEVHGLIQNVSPTPDFTTNNQMLVDTIVDVSSTHYPSDFVLKSELTNDVCAIVTNASTKWCIEQPSEWELYDTPAFDGLDRWWVRAVIDGNTEFCFSVGNEQSTRLDFYRTNPETLEDEEVFVAVLKTSNTLGLARLTDISPTVSNTVTKSYVESLGIESGVDAQTVTNMTALTPIYSQTPTYANEWTFNLPGDFYVVDEYDDSLSKWIYSLDVEGMPYGGNHYFDSPQTTIDFSSDYPGLIATKKRTDIIGYTLGYQTNDVIAATNALISASITNGFVSASDLTTATNGLISASTATNIAESVASEAKNSILSEIRYDRLMRVTLSNYNATAIFNGRVMSKNDDNSMFLYGTLSRVEGEAADYFGSHLSYYFFSCLLYFNEYGDLSGSGFIYFSDAFGYAVNDKPNKTEMTFDYVSIEPVDR